MQFLGLSCFLTICFLFGYNFAYHFSFFQYQDKNFQIWLKILYVHFLRQCFQKIKFLLVLTLILPLSHLSDICLSPLPKHFPSPAVDSFLFPFLYIYSFLSLSLLPTFLFTLSFLFLIVFTVYIVTVCVCLMLYIILCPVTAHCYSIVPACNTNITYFRPYNTGYELRV
jgi:hypothetical protein